MVLLYPGEEKVCEDGVGGWAGHQQREGRGGVQAGLRAEAEHVQQAAAAHGAHPGLESVKRPLVNGQTRLLFIGFLLLPNFRKLCTNRVDLFNNLVIQILFIQCFFINIC